MILKKFNYTFLAMLGCSLLLASCGERNAGEETVVQTDIDSSKAAIVNVGGKLFSIPSPIQTAILAKESGIKYEPGKLNSFKNVANYTGRTQKALNLGIFGADMAYASLYDDNQNAINYFKAIEKLSNELEITGAIDAELVKRLGSNAGNTDSLLVLSTQFYREADAYLKENERYDIASLIIAGGWLEAAYITSMAAMNGNEEARQRLAEQKKPLKDIISLLESHEIENNQDLVNELNTLLGDFSGIKSAYEFQRPVTVADEKLTIIKSTSSFDVSDSTLSAITHGVEEIRTKITQR